MYMLNSKKKNKPSEKSNSAADYRKFDASNNTFLHIRFT